MLSLGHVHEAAEYELKHHQAIVDEERDESHLIVNVTLNKINITGLLDWGKQVHSQSQEMVRVL